VFKKIKLKIVCRLNFDCNNNVVEYEALIIGLLLLKDMKAKRVNIFGDSELVIN